MGSTTSEDVAVFLGGEATLQAVEVLARLQLAAKRNGCTLRICVGDDLRQLLVLVGLDEALALEPRVQPEERE